MPAKAKRQRKRTGIKHVILISRNQKKKEMEYALKGTEKEKQALEGTQGRTVLARKGHLLDWDTTIPTAILFDPISPFPRLHYSNTNPRGEFLDNLGNPPGPLKGPGRFRYYVAQWDEEKKKIWIDDPDVVVDY